MLIFNLGPCQFPETRFFVNNHIDIQDSPHHHFLRGALLNLRNSGWHWTKQLVSEIEKRKENFESFWKFSTFSGSVRGVFSISIWLRMITDNSIVERMKLMFDCNHVISFIKQLRSSITHRSHPRELVCFVAHVKGKIWCVIWKLFFCFCSKARSIRILLCRKLRSIFIYNLALSLYLACKSCTLLHLNGTCIFLLSSD